MGLALDDEALKNSTTSNIRCVLDNWHLSMPKNRKEKKNVCAVVTVNQRMVAILRSLISSAI